MEDVAFIVIFAGKGGTRLLFEEVGNENGLTSEVHGDVGDTCEAKFRERPSGDVTRIKSEENPTHEVLLAGFP